jgi:hypothetical protein
LRKKIVLSIVILNLLFFSIFFINFGKSDDYETISFNFEKDTLGELPKSFEYGQYNASGYSYAKIVKDIGTRTGKCLEFYYHKSDASFTLLNYLENEIVKGSATYYVRTDNLSSLNTIKGFSSTPVADCCLVILGDYLGAGAGVYDGTYGNKLVSITVNKWYKLQLIFDCDTDLFDVKVNDSLVGEDIDFVNAVDFVDLFGIGAGKFFGSSEHTFWLDDIVYKDKTEVEVKTEPVIFDAFSFLGETPYVRELIIISGFSLMFFLYRVSKKVRKVR